MLQQFGVGGIRDRQPRFGERAAAERRTRTRDSGELGATLWGPPGSRCGIRGEGLDEGVADHA
ncbi:hypothetical protein [Microbacterium oryzae]|uniref:hypothetical protein n=1 Tax=Microbacterium oryzae TaxID=743009 RepID=UPI0031E0ED1F